MRKALFAVYVNGSDISGALSPVVMSIRVSDKAGTASDTAQIEVDDREGRIVMPEKGAPIRILLGWDTEGASEVFQGTVDEVRARGDRGGRTMSISAKGVDTSAKGKERKQKHWDDATIETILQDAGKAAGIGEVKVDPAFAKTKRAYERMDDESFIAFGERLAKELGGTFKVSGKRAILAKRNGGTSPGGQPLATISAVWGKNLHSYDIAPYLGRPHYKRTRARYYDKEAATWREVEVETALDDSEATGTARFTVPDELAADDKTKSDAAESERNSGEGTVTIEGNTTAQPEAPCEVVGTRPGIDGTYRIDGVDHDYSRSGFTTTLTLREPTGEAGKDSRGGKSKKKKGRGKAEEEDDFEGLATDPELG